MSEKYLGEVSTPLLINQIKEKCALQYSTMPTASASLEGKIAQYVGVTTSNYTNGYWYKCVGNGDPIVYSWEEIDTQAVDLPYVTPQDFGAKADGVTDDTAAIVAAINHGGAIFFPKGEYLVKSGNMITLSSDTALIGIDRNEAIIKCYYGTVTEELDKHIFVIKGASHKFSMEHLGIVYDRNSSTTPTVSNNGVILYLIQEFDDINIDDVYLHSGGSYSTLANHQLIWIKGGANNISVQNSLMEIFTNQSEGGCLWINPSNNMFVSSTEYYEIKNINIHDNEFRSTNSDEPIAIWTIPTDNNRKLNEVWVHDNTVIHKDWNGNGLLQPTHNLLAVYSSSSILSIQGAISNNIFITDKSERHSIIKEVYIKNLIISNNNIYINDVDANVSVVQPFYLENGEYFVNNNQIFNHTSVEMIIINRNSSVEYKNNTFTSTQTNIHIQDPYGSGLTKSNEYNIIGNTFKFVDTTKYVNMYLQADTNQYMNVLFKDNICDTKFTVSNANGQNLSVLNNTFNASNVKLQTVTWNSNGSTIKWMGNTGEQILFITPTDTPISTPDTFEYLGREEDIVFNNGGVITPYSQAMNTLFFNGNGKISFYKDVLETYTAGDGIDITNNTISVIDRLEETTALPTASASNLNKVYLLTATQTGYLKGGIYECISDGQDPATYSWELISFNPDSLGTAAFKNSTDRVMPNSTDLVESRSVYSAIQTAVSSIYTPRGEITCAELTSDLLISDNVGNVYETSDSGTTTALFLQGAGVPIATGTNIGIINAGQGRIMFNLMANAFDLTSYQKKDLTSAVEGETTVEGALGALSDNKQAKTLTTSVESQTTVEGALGALSTNKATQAEVNDMNNILGAKNLTPSKEISQTKSEVTFTVDNDGVVTLNGTSNNVIFRSTISNTNPENIKIHLKKGTYTYSLCDTEITGVSLVIKDMNGNDILRTTSIKGANFTLSEDKDVTIDWRIESGTTFSNTKFKAMIRLASDPDNTYVPYVPTNAKLNEEKVSWEDNGILGAKNFVPYPYPVSNATVNGITFTTYSDGRVVANGTATDLAILDVINSELYEPFSLDEGSYILTDGLSSNDYENAYTAITLTFSDSTIEYNRADTSIGKNKFSMPSKSNIKYFYLGCCVKSGATVSNLIFRPMIRLATDNDSTYQPYAMTNQQITPYVQAISNPNLLDNPWFTVNQRGQSTYNLTENGMTADRWAASVSAGTMIVGVSSNGLTITEASDVGDGGLIERINKPELLGKIVTISIDDGTNIYHVTGTIPSVQPAHWTEVCGVTTSGGINAALFIAPVGVTTFQLQYVIRVRKDNTAYTIRAVKLELGTVSTLAMDIAPNYQQELLKCQRYFYAFNGKPNLSGHSFAIIGTGYATSANNIRVPFYLPVEMRSVPTVSVSALSDVVIMSEVVDAGTPSAIALDSASCDRNNIGLFNITSDGNFVKGHSASVYTKNGCRIDLSSDL